jgi:hypothetical protein
MKLRPAREEVERLAAVYVETPRDELMPWIRQLFEDAFKDGMERGLDADEAFTLAGDFLQQVLDEAQLQMVDQLAGKVIH